MTTLFAVIKQSQILVVNIESGLFELDNSFSTLTSPEMISLILSPYCLTSDNGSSLTATTRLFLVMTPLQTWAKEPSPSLSFSLYSYSPFLRLLTLLSISFDTLKIKLITNYRNAFSILIRTSQCFLNWIYQSSFQICLVQKQRQFSIKNQNKNNKETHAIQILLMKAKKVSNYLINDHVFVHFFQKLNIFNFGIFLLQKVVQTKLSISYVIIRKKIFRALGLITIYYSKQKKNKVLQKLFHLLIPISKLVKQFLFFCIQDRHSTLHYFVDIQITVFQMFAFVQYKCLLSADLQVSYFYISTSLNKKIFFHGFSVIRVDHTTSMLLTAFVKTQIVSDNLWLDPLNQLHFIVVNKILMGGGQSQERVYSIPLENTKKPGFSHIYRNEKTINGLLSTPNPDLHSMKDVILNSVKKYSNKEFMGNIVLNGNTNAEGVEGRDIKKYTYQQIFEMAENLGSFLVQNGLYFQEKINGMKFIGIFSKNRWEWIVADIACILYGLTIIPLYDTLGVENLTYCLEHSEVKTCFVSSATIKSLLKLKGYGQLQNIISFDQISPQSYNQLKKHSFNSIPFEEAILKRKNFTPHNNVSVNQRNCLTFSYTSGTTGPPKGAMLSHGNFLAFLAAFEAHEIGGFKEDDSYVSFLPLPHVFERVIIASLMYCGSFIAFFNGDIMKVKDDLAFIKPTIFVAVPRLFNRITESVQKKFEEASGIKGCLIKNGVSSKMDSLHKNGSYSSGFYDKIVFSKVRDGFGGRVRLMVTGSAPIKKDVFQFMKVIMCCPFYEGYGQTENTAAAFIQGTIQAVSGHVGGIVSDLEFKLSDIPEMHYTSDDKDEEGRPAPRGQIWLRGPGVFMGYYKDEEKTRQAITPDGWLKTGDVGVLLPGSNAMKIIDRKKNIFKLQQGEYVAAEKVQAIYTKSHIIQEVFLHGESHHNFAIAIVTVRKEEFMKLAEKHNIQGSFESLCNNREMRILVCKELDAVGKQNGLLSFEQAKNVYIDPETFVARDIVTNTFKLQRFQAKKFYAKQIQDMYNEDMLPIK